MKQNLKKAALILLAALIVFSLVFASASSAFAIDEQMAVQNVLVTDDGFEYTVNEAKITITGYSGEAAEINIPAEIDTLPVTAVAARAFEAKTGITEVTLPDSIVSVGDNAFDGCSALVIVNIGAGVNSLGRDVFAECINLTAIFVSENSIHYSSENGVLFDKNKSALLYYPQGNSRDVYEVPKGISSIGDGAFSGCGRLRSVVMSSGLKYIGSRAFLGCENIEEITIPDSVSTIGAYAFASLKKITKIKLPVALSEISEAMLSECTGLVSIELPASLKTIGADAFSYCSALESITIPEGVSSIGDGAFTRCRALRSITLPLSLKSIPHNAFSTCESLSNVNFAGTEGQWKNLKCELYNAMIVYNFTYDSAEDSSKPSDETTSGTSSVPAQSDKDNIPSDTEDNTSFETDGSSSGDVLSGDDAQQTTSKPQQSESLSSTFIAAGKDVVFFENDVLTLSGDENALPKLSETKVSGIYEGIDYVRVKAAVRDYVEKFLVYDIVIEEDGKSIKPAAAIRAQFKIPEGYDIKKVQILYVSDRGGAVELKSKVNKKTNTVSADITETGTYVVAQMLHNTQGMSVGAVTLIIALIALAGFALAYFLVYKPKIKAKK